MRPPLRPIAALPLAPLKLPQQSRLVLFKSIIKRAGVLLVASRHGWRWQP